MSYQTRTPEPPNKSEQTRTNPNKPEPSNLMHVQVCARPNLPAIPLLHLPNQLVVRRARIEGAAQSTPETEAQPTDVP